LDGISKIPSSHGDKCSDCDLVGCDTTLQEVDNTTAQEYAAFIFTVSSAPEDENSMSFENNFNQKTNEEFKMLLILAPCSILPLIVLIR
jgi:hypothetical protein